MKNKKETPQKTDEGERCEVMYFTGDQCEDHVGHKGFHWVWNKKTFFNYQGKPVEIEGEEQGQIKALKKVLVMINIINNKFIEKSGLIEE
ncbi:MAG: hypothetical protein AABY22_36810, partial [Nanoarchaeota archaeon]